MPQPCKCLNNSSCCCYVQFGTIAYFVTTNLLLEHNGKRWQRREWGSGEGEGLGFSQCTCRLQRAYGEETFSSNMHATCEASIYHLSLWYGPSGKAKYCDSHPAASGSTCTPVGTRVTCCNEFRGRVSCTLPVSFCQSLLIQQVLTVCVPLYCLCSTPTPPTTSRASARHLLSSTME